METAKPSYNVDCPVNPEKYIGTTTTNGKLSPSIQGLQKRGPKECIRKYSRQLVHVCCYWHYFGGITNSQARAISETARTSSYVYIGTSL